MEQRVPRAVIAQAQGCRSTENGHLIRLGVPRGAFWREGVWGATQRIEQDMVGGAGIKRIADRGTTRERQGSQTHPDHGRSCSLLQAGPHCLPLGQD